MRQPRNGRRPVPYGGPLYPIDDLREAVRRPDLTDNELAKITGVSRRMICRARAAGGFDDYQADEVAVRLGIHPLQVWPHWDVWVAPEGFFRVLSGQTFPPRVLVPSA